MERKSVSSSEKKASAKPRAPPSVLTDASDLVFGRVVGRGTQGTVRLAKHRTTGKRYVVKLLPLETHGSAIASGREMNLPCDPMCMTDDDARRVVAEAEVLKLASDHPNVVRFHGAFRRDVPPSSSSRRTSEHLASGDASVPASRGDPSRDSAAAPSPSSPRASELCIVMSHCEGGDLASLLRRVKQAGPHALLPEDAVMRWLVQLLLGLNHIHRKAILHRDIKPANVFLSKSRKVVRLGDFGIAKKLREDDDLATTVVGTPLYMSPELCQGKPYTYASDIWALGCVAYEMASGGAKAFDAPGWPQLLLKIVRGDYAPVPSHLSRPFAALVASMLSPDPAERPTAEQLLGAVVPVHARVARRALDPGALRGVGLEAPRDVHVRILQHRGHLSRRVAVLCADLRDAQRWWCGGSRCDSSHRGGDKSGETTRWRAPRCAFTVLCGPRAAAACQRARRGYVTTSRCYRLRPNSRLAAPGPGKRLCVRTM